VAITCARRRRSVYVEFDYGEVQRFNWKCVKLRLSLLSNPDLKLICFLLLSANYSTYLFRERLCSRLTALWRYIIIFFCLTLGRYIPEGV